MSESLRSLLRSLHVKTSSIPFGVNVEWRWPEGICLDSRLELQYLSSDGQLKKELINWPVQSLNIDGLKAGEHLQIRLRIIGRNGIARDWQCSDWIEGVSSTNAGDYLGNICATVKVSGYENGKQATTGMSLAGEIPPQSVSANMTVKKSSVRSFAEETKIRLSDEMRDAVVDAVRNSDLHEALRASCADTMARVEQMKEVLASLQFSYEQPKQVVAVMNGSQVKENDIAITTLAAVLAKVLPATEPKYAADVAKQMAEAVKAGFGAMRPADASPR